MRIPTRALLVVLGLVAACSDGDGRPGEVDAVPACADGLDNDADGLIDTLDPDCTSPDDNDEAGAVTTCNDGMDNDGDGLIDYPDDPGCLVPQQDSGESDDCPSGPNCPECANGLDDDADGLIDFAGNDPGCAAASDRQEFSFDAMACGPGTSVSALPQSGTVSGTLSAGTSNVSTTCGGSSIGSGPEVAFVITVTRPATLVATTDFPGTTFDTVLYLRRACTDEASQLACADDVAGGTNTRSTLTVSLQPGSYFLVVDGKTAGSTGAYVLIANLYVGQGEACVDPDDCAPGFVCRQVPGATEETCERPVCSDGRDDDGDGLIDYPVDPGCTTPDDSTETDTCPGAGCPQCGNGADDDNDGETDYPDDTSCTSASGTSEEDCPVETDPLFAIVSGGTTGTTIGGTDNFDLSCGFPTGDPDRVHMLYLRAPLASLTIDTAGSEIETVLGLMDGLCAGEIACNNNAPSSTITRAGVPAGPYAIVVDGFFGSGAYALNVRGTYAINQPCDPDAPMFSCATGYACTGAFPGATCQPAACNDTTDADGDGLPGYPTDPGCTSTSDGDETDDCPSGPNCPQCSNDLDDDGDGQIDYPMDSGCLSASGASEQCVSTDPVRSLPPSGEVTNQSTTTLADDFDLSCGLNGRDEVYRVVVDFPLDEIRAETTGSSLDAVVAIKRTTCSSFDLQCDDDTDGDGDSEVFLVDPVIGEHYIIVDDKNAANPPTYNLKVSGHYLDGGRCNPTNVFTCSTGFACTGAAGAETCAPAACNDTVDADGDGFPGYPTDPGCTSPSDGDETDNCPSGPGCPVCANGLDDDGDNMIDYPMDVGCLAASGSTEVACAGELDPLILVSMGNYTGTTNGASNDFLPSCRALFSVAPDRVFMLTLPVPVTNLRLATFGSDYDTTLILKPASCGTAELACDDDGGVSLDSLIDSGPLAAGTYAVVMDGASSGSAGAYVLDIDGTVAAGQACTSPLFAAGVLQCSGTCNAGVCQ